MFAAMIFMYSTTGWQGSLRIPHPTKEIAFSFSAVIVGNVILINQSNASAFLLDMISIERFSNCCTGFGPVCFEFFKC